MSRRKTAVAVLSAIAIGAACEIAHAQQSAPEPADASGTPAYTLEVDSDALDVVSYEALAARIGSDLGAPVVRPGATSASRVAITIRYRDRELVVRALHPGGRVLERSVKAEGDDAAVQREAVLLAGNLARDEARELLDALAARREPAAPAAPRPATAPAPPAAEGLRPVNVGLFFPLATNYGRPNATSYLDLSLLYGRIGRVEGVQLGGGVVHASRSVDGAQLATAAAATSGPVDGVQMAGVGTYAAGHVTGAELGGALNLALGGMNGGQLSGAFNFVRGETSGAQLSGGLNLVRGSVSGAQIAGAANIATRDVDGAQLGSVNVAENVVGAQIGVINVGRKVKGAQIGVINIAEEVDGVALGVISVSRNAIHPVVWASNLQYMNAGIKFSTEYAYTILAANYGTLEGDFDNFGTTVAIGAHLPLPARFDLEVQGSITHLIPRPSQSTKSGNVWTAPQAIVGYTLAPHLRVFAGGGARLPVSVDLGRDVVRPEVLAGVQF